MTYQYCSLFPIFPQGQLSLVADSTVVLSCCYATILCHGQLTIMS